MYCFHCEDRLSPKGYHFCQKCSEVFCPHCWLSHEDCEQSDDIFNDEVGNETKNHSQDELQ